MEPREAAASAGNGPSCKVQQHIACETLNSCFRRTYPAQCSQCGWAGDCSPYKKADLCCPRCAACWQDIRIEAGGKSWLEFLSATFFCDRCQDEVSALLCRMLMFRCGNASCAAWQAIHCDPWTETGPATVHCRVCPWAGSAQLVPC
eukprot:gnl/TRDRNA2_/TRDRNA2_83313_c0_seq1.p1 gnl/TRDRNA2_/TRDRNA2_83313_c0~~gnl/TRDRNA2_/TRDRNA2_83313_c0_seq1.p1  ORF type:complete len:147 (-),score=6.83 gnl/TRDRNA2_/TRDRNA2_83313_c0_seq1:122-562(-)